MENTEDLEIDIDDIGTILKSSRLKQKKTMEEISSELCIRKIYLTALEEGDYETLPPVPYGVGYVRTYARYLGLNPERAVKLYKAASVAEDIAEEESKEIPEVNKSSSRHIVVGILAVVLIYAGWSWYSNLKTSKIAEVLPMENTFVEEPSVSDVSEMSIDENIINEETSEENIQEEVSELPVKNTVEQDDITEISTEETPTIENKVVLEFKGESWIELKDKNKVYFQGVFHKGDKKEIDYTDNLFLSVGRPYNVKVTIKGAEKNILAKRRKMNIPLDSLE